MAFAPVAAVVQADDGYLYPLDRAFFYIQKPPMLIPFDEVESVELTRLGGNTVSSKTFDLVVRTRSDVEHQFRCVGVIAICCRSPFQDAASVEAVSLWEGEGELQASAQVGRDARHA